MISLAPWRMKVRKETRERVKSRNPKKKGLLLKNRTTTKRVRKKKGRLMKREAQSKTKKKKASTTKRKRAVRKR
jgi:hypothetical protein